MVWKLKFLRGKIRFIIVRFSQVTQYNMERNETILFTWSKTWKLKPTVFHYGRTSHNNIILFYCPQWLYPVSACPRKHNSCQYERPQNIDTRLLINNNNNSNDVSSRLVFEMVAFARDIRQGHYSAKDAVTYLGVTYCAKIIPIAW